MITGEKEYNQLRLMSLFIFFILHVHILSSVTVITFVPV